MGTQLLRTCPICSLMLQLFTQSRHLPRWQKKLMLGVLLAERTFSTRPLRLLKWNPKLALQALYTVL